jgi:hypothetical protein
MSEVLTPCLELFGGPTDILAELDKSVSKAMRVEIWQASTDKSFAKYRSNFAFSSVQVGLFKKG